jgi:RNA polymerase sigma-70 factor (ECF subfamily)
MTSLHDSTDDLRLGPLSTARRFHRAFVVGLFDELARPFALGRCRVGPFGWAITFARARPRMTRQPSSAASPSKQSGDVHSADLDLARRCGRGDTAAFEELYRAHAPRLFSLLLRMTGSEPDAEDLLQDVFLQAHRKVGGFRGESGLGTWLYRMAVNQALDFLRSRQAKMSRATASYDEDDSAEPISPIPLVPAVISRVDLERAIARLPDGCRTVFVLHDVEGFAHHEVASLLGISEGTSKSQVHKARHRLRSLLSAALR